MDLGDSGPVGQTAALPVARDPNSALGHVTTLSQPMGECPAMALRETLAHVTHQIAQVNFGPLCSCLFFFKCYVTEFTAARFCCSSLLHTLH